MKPNSRYEEEESRWSALAPRSGEDSYEDAHEWLRELDPSSSDDSWIFGSMRGLDRPLVDSQPKEVLTRVRSFSPEGGPQRLINHLRHLSRELNECKDLKPETDDLGFVGPSGVHKSFDSLRTVAGMCSSPMSYVPIDNTSSVASKGLPTDAFRSEVHEAIFEELWSEVLSRYLPTSLKVPKFSSSGFPVGTSDPVFKARTATWLLSNHREVVPLMGKRDFGELARQYGIVRCYKQQKRTQVDPPGKTRWAYDLDYARSGGAKGKEVEVDKQVKIAGVVHEDFSRLRVRVIHGAPWLCNVYAQAFATGFMYAMFEWAAPTFHHTNMNHIADLIERNGDAVFSDISNYDTTMSEFLLRRMAKVARKYIAEEVVQWIEDMFFAPYFTQPISYVTKDGRSVATSRPLMMGSPFDPSSEVVAGNRSGHAWTSLVAKVMKVFDTLCVIDDLHSNVRGNVKRYLEHKMPLKIVNNGDDEGLIGPADMVAVFRKYRFNPHSNPGYFVAEQEVGQVFSGFMFMKKGGRVIAVPRLHTTLEKLYVPERSIGGMFRPFWPIGVEQRLTLDLIQRADYNVNPGLRCLLDIHSKVWRERMEPHYGRLVSILVDAKSRMPTQINTGQFSRIDYEVLEEPDKLIYKYKDSAVSPEVLRMVAGANIQPTVFEDFINEYYFGDVYEYH